MKIKTITVLLITICIFASSHVDIAKAQKVSPGTEAQPTPPVPTQAVRPTPTIRRTSPTPAPTATITQAPSDNTSSGGDSSPKPVVITFPQSSTSQASQDNSSPDNIQNSVTQDSAPTPVLLPEPDSPVKEPSVYSVDTTPTPTPVKSKMGIIGSSLLLNGKDSTQPSTLYASENISPAVTKFLLIFSLSLFIFGIALINYDKIFDTVQGSISPKNEGTVIFPGYNEL